MDMRFEIPFILHGTGYAKCDFRLSAICHYTIFFVLFTFSPLRFPLSALRSMLYALRPISKP